MDTYIHKVVTGFGVKYRGEIQINPVTWFHSNAVSTIKIPDDEEIWVIRRGNYTVGTAKRTRAT